MESVVENRGLVEYQYKMHLKIIIPLLTALTLSCPCSTQQKPEGLFPGDVNQRESGFRITGPAEDGSTILETRG